MFNLTRQERQVVLFLITIALIGLGINFCLKSNSKAKRIFVIDINLSKIDLNQVRLQDLLGTRYISKTLAEKIIAYRNTRGRIEDLEELKQIKGINSKRYEKLKDLFFIQ
ncbi:MAG: helix-hairpin-helix domain-containing protein [Candidatus Omnitrophota bacterium]